MYKYLFGATILLFCVGACNEQKDSCYKHGTIGDCMHLCAQKDNKGCLKADEIGTEKCIKNSDIATCNTLCASDMPTSKVYCAKQKTLCSKAENKKNEYCSLQ